VASLGFYAIQTKRISQIRFLNELGVLDRVGLSLTDWLRRYVLRSVPDQNETDDKASN
jgi:hypothetical protein